MSLASDCCPLGRDGRGGPAAVALALGGPSHVSHGEGWTPLAPQYSDSADYPLRALKPDTPGTDGYRCTLMRGREKSYFSDDLYNR